MLLLASLKFSTMRRRFKRLFTIIMSEVKSGVFDTFEIENIVADVLHVNKSTGCEHASHVSIFNNEVMDPE